MAQYIFRSILIDIGWFQSISVDFYRFWNFYRTRLKVAYGDQFSLQELVSPMVRTRFWYSSIWKLIFQELNRELQKIKENMTNQFEELKDRFRSENYELNSKLDLKTDEIEMKLKDMKNKGSAKGALKQSNSRNSDEMEAIREVRDFVTKSINQLNAKVSKQKVRYQIWVFTLMRSSIDTFPFCAPSADSVILCALLMVKRFFS